MQAWGSAAGQGLWVHRLLGGSRMQAEELTTPVAPGSNGEDVRRVQEWLNLRGFPIPITGVFGSSTAAAVVDFCHAQGVHPRSAVDRELFALLSRPLHLAIAAGTQQALGATVARVARLQLEHRARALAGPAGPWVRLYAGAPKTSAWASAFAVWCQRRGRALHGLPDVPAASRAVRGSSGEVEVGDLFIASARTGVVVGLDENGFTSIEVVNDEVASHEHPFEVCCFVQP